MGPDSIACGIPDKLPNEEYSNFVSRYLRTQGNDLLDDPFVLYLPIERVEQFYVPREAVAGQILKQGCNIIVGKSGSGKTILWQTLGKSTRDTLRLRLTLDDNNVPRQDLESFLAYHIFKAYQERLLAPSPELEPHLSSLVTNTLWRNTFHHLYYHCYLEYQARIEDEKPLCENPGFSERSFHSTPASDILRELCNFVVSPPGYDHFFGKASSEWPYKAIQVFADCSDDLSDKSFLDLIQSVQRVCAMSSDIPDIKLFISQDQEALIDKSNFSEIGFFYHLPPWRPEELYNLLVTRLGHSGRTYNLETSERGIPPGMLKELREILSRCPEFKDNTQLSAVFVDARIVGWRYGLHDTFNIQARVNAAIDYLLDAYNDKGENVFILFLSVLSDLRAPRDQRHLQLQQLIDNLEPILQPSARHIDPHCLNIPTNVLSYDSRLEFIQIVVNGALRAYTQPTKFDAPIHALKLARGLTAACADCWRKRFPRPLNTQQLREIVNSYWEEEKCNG
mgnify:CR=1 FL=1